MVFNVTFNNISVI